MRFFKPWSASIESWKINCLARCCMINTAIKFRELLYFTKGDRTLFLMISSHSSQDSSLTHEVPFTHDSNFSYFSHKMSKSPVYDSRSLRPINRSIYYQILSYNKISHIHWVYGKNKNNYNVGNMCSSCVLKPKIRKRNLRVIKFNAVFC